MWELARILIMASGLRAVYEASRSSSCESLRPAQDIVPQTASQEIAEFAELPPQLRRQLLDYGSGWVNALYEPG